MFNGNVDTQQVLSAVGLQPEIMADILQTVAVVKQVANAQMAASAQGESAAQSSAPSAQQKELQGLLETADGQEEVDIEAMDEDQAGEFFADDIDELQGLLVAATEDSEKSDKSHPSKVVCGKLLRRIAVKSKASAKKLKLSKA